jgi:hypothetical protein
VAAGMDKWQYFVRHGEEKPGVQQKQ